MPDRPTEDHSIIKQPVLIANGFSPVPVPSGHLVDTYRRAGFYPVMAEFLFDDMTDVRRYAKHIALILRGLHDSLGVRIDVVGISMGGVAALHAIKYLASARFVRTMVTVGSPLKGSPLAFLGEWTFLFSLTGRQLALDSEFLKKLHEEELPSGPRFVSVSGYFDLICPPSVSTLDGADNRLLPFQHYDVMFAVWLHEEVAKILKE